MLGGSECMLKVYQFCQRHFFAIFVLFGVAGCSDFVLPHIPLGFQSWTSLVRVLVLIASGVALAIGLIREGRRLPAGRKDKSGR
jgi:hypothetical protein